MTAGQQAEGPQEGQEGRRVIEPWELAVREAVRDTLARYNHAGDRGRAGELAEQFTPDGVLEVQDSLLMEGRPAIARFIAETVRAGMGGAARDGRPATVRHHVSSVLIHDVTPERAKAVSYFAVLTRDGLDHWGRYRDVLVPYGGRWLLSHRLVRIDAHRAGSAAAEPL